MISSRPKQEEKTRDLEYRMSEFLKGMFIEEDRDPSKHSLNVTAVVYRVRKENGYT
jgi:hypothetical protein